MRSSGVIRVVLCAVLVILSFATGGAAPGSTEEAARDVDTKVRGITVRDLSYQGTDDGEAATAGGKLPEMRRGPLAHYGESSQSDSDWVLIDSETFMAYVPVGDAFTVRFDLAGDSLVCLAPELPLTDLARQAVAYAPDWLELELEDAFSRLDSANQDAYGTMILSTSDPTVDEVAFVIAHTAPEVLQAWNFNPQVITENAGDVYAHDPYLDYVDIVDYGSAAAGGAYYSTVLYRTAETGDTLEVELSRDRYYWDIVHIKITDEPPAYINPAGGAIADPPLGRFWREFLFTHADSGYAVLRDELAGCEVLWEGNVDSRTNGAIGIITQWILDVLDFDSDAERPIQPVRIYRKHKGRCGEHADITCAAARAALIPTNSPLAMASDHTWNEFYDGRWIHWEPVNVYVDSPWHYEGWGKEFLGIFNWRGDDWIWTVTERYTPYCTLTVAVTDSLGYPVDGALVSVAKKTGSITYQEATWTATDHTGTCQFLLGDNNDIYGRIESDLGTVPPGPLHKKITLGSQADSHYVWSRMVSLLRPRLPVLPAAPAPGPDDGYRIILNWEATSQFCYGQNKLDNNTFAERMEGGAVEFFICDEPNYAAYASADSFLAYEIMEDMDSAAVDFTVPVYGTWYAVLSNEEHVVNSQVLDGTVELYRRVFADVAAGELEHDTEPMLAQNSPNPFSPETWISYTIARDTHVEMKVYDIKGRLVRTLMSGDAPAGKHRATWDGRDSEGRPAATGIYLYRLETPERSISRKMTLIR
jgi:hypothetical protein